MLDQDLYRTIVDASETGILVATAIDGRVLFANAAARDVLEWFENSPLHLSSVFPKVVRKDPYLEDQDLIQLEGHLEDIYMLKEDQTLIIASVGLRKVQKKGEELIVLLFRDVSQQKRLEREIELKHRGLRDALHELSEQNKALSALDEAKTRFIYLITHELRTPLTALISSAEFLVAGIHDTPEDEKMLKSTVYAQSTLLLETVNSVLDLTRLKAGKLEYYIELADPRVIGETVVTSFRDLAAQKEIELAMDSGSETLDCYFDPVRLRQILANLLSNAIKFSGQKTKVKMSFHLVNDRTEVRVVDQGIGIPEDQKHLIFQEFSVLTEMRTHSQGSGLGLSISKSIAENMGAEIHFTSEEGKGSVFSVHLPRQKVCSLELYRSRHDGALNLLDPEHEEF